MKCPICNTKLFKCNHNWEIFKRSNALQLDDMGYPLRLFIYKCAKCGKSEQRWVDVPLEELAGAFDELKADKSVLVKWT